MNGKSFCNPFICNKKLQRFFWWKSDIFFIILWNWKQITDISCHLWHKICINVTRQNQRYDYSLWYVPLGVLHTISRIMQIFTWNLLYYVAETLCYKIGSVTQPKMCTLCVYGCCNVYTFGPIPSISSPRMWHPHCFSSVSQGIFTENHSKINLCYSIYHKHGLCGQSKKDMIKKTCKYTLYLHSLVMYILCASHPFHTKMT